MSVSTHKTVTIANAATASGAIDLGSETLVGVFIPAAFTGTAISFQVSPTLNGTYGAVVDSAGVAVGSVVATGNYVPCPPAVFAGIRNVKIVSNAAEGGARVVALATRQIV